MTDRLATIKELVASTYSDDVLVQSHAMTKLKADARLIIEQLIERLENFQSIFGWDS